MKKIVLAVLMGLIVGVVGVAANGTKESGAGNAGSAQPIVIKIGHDNSVSTPGHLAFVKFKEIVEAESKGRITVNIFPGSQLGSVQDMFEQTRRGDVDMSVGASTLFSQTIPEFAVWDSFYMFDDAAHAHRVLDGKAGTELMKPLDRMNLVGLGYMEIGFRNFSNSKRPIMKVEDVKGLKIRGYSPIQIAAWESVGCSLSNLAWAEVFTSLQQNLIDGQECATTSFESAKFYEAQKYWSLTRHIYTNWLWYANKDFMNKLSAADRALVEKAAKMAITYNRELMASAEVAALAKFSKLGVMVNEVPLDARLAMGKAMNATVGPQIIAKCGPELYKLVNDEIVKERK